MLWEIADDIKKYVKMTLIPAIRNLFSSARSLVGMLLVMVILQMLLSVICIFVIENIKNQQTVLKDFQVTLATVSDIIEDAQGSFMTSDTFVTALNSTSIFIGALVMLGGRMITSLWGNELTEYRGKTVGFVFQSHKLIPHLTAYENILLPLNAAGRKLEKHEERFKLLVDALDIRDSLKQTMVVVTHDHKTAERADRVYKRRR